MLAPGAKIGAFEIVGTLGAGGMGEVYRARDTRLGRDVAIKILPEMFASDPDRLMRFEREAKALASLNHPHIAQIYGVEEGGASAPPTHALVMELVEGEDLSQRIARGPIPAAQVIAIATQIAEALEAAHEAGIIHRDLKPANVKVRSDGTVKLLDFGIARALTPETHDAETLARDGVTESGRVIGTASYMSPEQARGGEIDKRTDIWAFGCVLYEMLTGQRAFDGATTTDIVAAVLEREPAWGQLPPNTPVAIGRLLRRSLAKNRRQRLADISDARLELVDAGEVANADVVRGSTRWTPSWRNAAAAAVVSAALFIAVAYMRWPPGPDVAVGAIRSSLLPPPGERLIHGTRAVAIAPDGSQVAFATDKGLYLRALDASESRRIAGADTSGNVVFSPDGSHLAQIRLAQIHRLDVRKLDLASGTSEVVPGPPIADLGGILPTVSWTARGLLGAFGAAGIWLMPDDASTWQSVLPPQPGEATSSAELMPDGEHLLFTLLPAAPKLGTTTSWEVVIQSTRTGQRTVVAENASDARYVSSGHILYVTDGVLLALPFDVGTLRPAGSALPVVQGIQMANVVNGTMHYAVADNGTLIYVPGQPAPARMALDLVITDRTGGLEHLHLPPASYETPRVSPDGQRVAASTDDGREASVWIKELSGTSAMRRLTVGARNRFPVWSSDGKRIAFQSDRGGDLGIYSQSADGADTPARLTSAEPGTAHIPESWFGNSLLFTEMRGAAAALFVLSLEDHRVAPFGGVTSLTPTTAAFSPDGKWVAYNTTTVRGASHTVYVQPFPATGAKYQVSSNDDGHHPAWSRDGSELLYVPGPFQLFAVKIRMSPFSLGPPALLPPAGLMGPGTVPRNYDIVDDLRSIGRHVAADDATRAGAPPRIELVTHWFRDFEQRRQ